MVNKIKGKYFKLSKNKWPWNIKPEKHVAQLYITFFEKYINDASNYLLHHNEKSTTSNQNQACIDDKPHKTDSKRISNLNVYTKLKDEIKDTIDFTWKLKFEY